MRTRYSGKLLSSAIIMSELLLRLPWMGFPWADCVDWWATSLPILDESLTRWVRGVWVRPIAGFSWADSMGWANSPPMLDKSPTEIGVAGKWERDVILARSKPPGAGTGSKLLIEVGPELMAKWADSPPMLDESPPEIRVAGKWVRDVIWVRSKPPGAGAGSMDVGLELMAEWLDSLLMLDESPPEIGVAGEWVRDVILVRSKLRCRHGFWDAGGHGSRNDDQRWCIRGLSGELLVVNGAHSVGRKQDRGLWLQHWGYRRWKGCSRTTEGGVCVCECSVTTVTIDNAYLARSLILVDSWRTTSPCSALLFLLLTGFLWPFITLNSSGKGKFFSTSASLFLRSAAFFTLFFFMFTNALWFHCSYMAISIHTCSLILATIILSPSSSCFECQSLSETSKSASVSTFTSLREAQSSAAWKESRVSQFSICHLLIIVLTKWWMKEPFEWKQKRHIIFLLSQEFLKCLSRFCLSCMRPAHPMSFISPVIVCLTYKKLMITLSCSGEGPPARIVIFHPVYSMSNAPITARDRGSFAIDLITKVSRFTLRYLLKTLKTEIQCF